MEGFNFYDWEYQAAHGNTDRIKELHAEGSELGIIYAAKAAHDGGHKELCLWLHKHYPEVTFTGCFSQKEWVREDWDALEKFLEHGKEKN